MNTMSNRVIDHQTHEKNVRNVKDPSPIRRMILGKKHRQRYAGAVVLTPMTQQRTVEESAECFLRVAATSVGWEQAIG